MCSLAAETSRKKPRKDSLLLVVANNVVVQSSGDALFDRRIVRSPNKHHGTHCIGFIDAVRIEGLPTVMGSAMARTDVAAVIAPPLTMTLSS